MPLTVRRVVTGHDKNGKAIVKIDEVISNVPEGRTGAFPKVIWSTEGFPASNNGDADESTRYERLEQIAYHYHHSGVARKAAHFTRLAGDKARARQADETALTFYAQTLTVPGKEEVATEKRRAYEGVGDVYVLQGDYPAAYASYQAALRGASTEAEQHLGAKLALLAPMVDLADTGTAEDARRSLPPSDPLRPWLGAALVWLYAGHNSARAEALCQELLPTAGEPVKILLEEAAEHLKKRRPFSPYADFITLFARSCLRLSPGDPL